MLVERRTDVSYETVTCWVVKFGTQIARNLRQRQVALVMFVSGLSRGEMHWNQGLTLAFARSGWHRSRRNFANVAR